MKKVYSTPELEVLDVKMTLMGPHHGGVDFSYHDEDETVVLHS